MSPTDDTNGPARPVQPTPVLSGLARANAPTLAFPKQISKYKIKRMIGQGGMGIVYEAEQERPRRSVALKVFKQGLLSSTLLRRFDLESELLGQLHHAGIAQVYEAGTWDDGHGAVSFYSMEYIPSATHLVEFAERELLTVSAKLQLFRQVCEAVHYAHQRGIIHRDLKPANILVDGQGLPKIIDFGVARCTDSNMAVTTYQTDIGQLIGTLQYMSPEQCSRDPQNVDARSDVYALGIILFELLTGEVPYDLSRAAIHEAVRIICQESPKPPSATNRALRGKLDAICLKAISKDRNKRYQSAAELSEEVQRYIENREIQAPARPGKLARLFSGRRVGGLLQQLTSRPRSGGVASTPTRPLPQDWKRVCDAAERALKRLSLHIADNDPRLASIRDPLRRLRVWPTEGNEAEQVQNLVRSLQRVLAYSGRYTLTATRGTKCEKPMTVSLYVRAVDDVRRSLLDQLPTFTSFGHLRDHPTLAGGLELTIGVDEDLTSFSSEHEVWNTWRAERAKFVAIWSSVVTDREEVEETRHLILPLAISCWESNEINVVVGPDELQLASRLRSGSIASLLR